MKTTMKNHQMTVYRLWMTVLIAVLPVLTGTVKATAPAYQNTYKGTIYKGQGTMYNIQSTAPAVGFQSTSAYAGRWENSEVTPMLNSDGTVNADAYMGAKAGSGPRRVCTGGPGTPGGSLDPKNQQPLGDAAIPLMLCAGVFFIVRAARRRKEIEP